MKLIRLLYIYRFETTAQVMISPIPVLIILVAILFFGCAKKPASPSPAPAALDTVARWSDPAPATPEIPTRTILFGVDVDTLLPHQAEILRATRAWAQATGTRLRVVGYADTSGSAAHNLALSIRRAAAAGAILGAPLEGAGETVRWGEKRANRRVQIMGTR